MRWASARPGRRGFSVKATQGVLKHTPCCQLNLPGCLITATQVDHIVSWPAAMALGWSQAEYDDVTNAQAVCAPCHHTKTQAEAQQGRARGRAKPAPKHPGLR